MRRMRGVLDRPATGGAALSAARWTVPLISALALGSVLPASGASGPPLVQVANLALPSPADGAFSQNSVALAADGATALVGDENDRGGDGAAWVFTRSGSRWIEQGKKLTGREAGTSFGFSVALSADGNTALIGDPNAGFDDLGAVWVYTRSGSTWTQQGAKLTRRGAGGRGGQFGSSVALSADGNTAVIGAPDSGESTGPGAVWVFKRSGSAWSQEGTALSGRGGSGTGFGTGVALSADGDTALVAGPDETIGTAAWVFVRSGSTWTQQGKTLNDSDGTSFGLTLSADGNTALVGAAGKSVARVFVRSGSSWTQQGSLAATGEMPVSVSVALSRDGNTALVGDEGNGNTGYGGAARVFTRSGSTWTQEGGSLTAKGETRNTGLGYSVSLSGDGTTALIGGNDTRSVAEAWVFQRP
jgi:hypothetical protein